jgi:hypothetical protein
MVLFMIHLCYLQTMPQKSRLCSKKNAKDDNGGLKWYMRPYPLDFF